MEDDATAWRVLSAGVCRSLPELPLHLAQAGADVFHGRAHLAGRGPPLADLCEVVEHVVGEFVLAFWHRYAAGLLIDAAASDLGADAPPALCIWRRAGAARRWAQVILSLLAHARRFGQPELVQVPLPDIGPTATGPRP